MASRAPDLPRPPPTLDVTWEDSRIVAHFHPYRQEFEGWWVLVLETFLTWVALNLILGLPLILLAIGVDSASLWTVLRQINLLTPAAVLCLLMARHTSRIRVTCSTTHLVLRRILFGIPLPARRLALESLRDVTVTAEGRLQTPKLRIQRRDRGHGVVLSLGGNTMPEGRWLAHLIAHAMRRNAAFWREQFVGADNDREKLRRLLEQRERG